MGATSESISSSMKNPNPGCKVKVRKRRASPSFLIIFGIFLAVSSFSSSKGGPLSPAQQEQQNLHDRVRKSPSDLPLHGPRLKSSDSEFLKNHRVTEHEPTSRSSFGPSIHDENGEAEGTESNRWKATESSTEPRHHETSTESERSSTGEPHHHNHTTTTESPAGPCTRPAVEQFPRPWMSQGMRRNGGFMVYILATAYTFLALAIVCDEFFVPSLDLLCGMLKISPDVAGATFMAAGSSAPELATALIGVFIAKES